MTINVPDIARAAAADFALSLRDDPTSWPNGAKTTQAEALRTANDAIREIVQSAISRALGGKTADDALAGMELELADNGPLADLDAVWAEKVHGLDVDLSGVREAADYDARLEALREAIGHAVHSYPVPTVTPAQFRAMAAADPRIAHLALKSDTPEDEDKVPAFLSLEKPAAAPAEAAGGETPADVDWDALEALEALEEPASQDPQPAALADSATSGPPLPALLSMIGFTDAEGAEVLGISRAYYSQMRNNKRPWQGVKPDAVERLRAELAGRRALLEQAESMLSDPSVTMPDI